MQRPIEKPAGTPIEQLDTPALLVDAERLQANVAAIESPLRAAAWIHKTPAIAHLELASEHVVGIAVRGIAEAEIFANAGCADIRILRPLVTAAAKRRAAELGASIRLVLEDDGVLVGGGESLAGAVSVSAGVTSVPEPGRAILDCGQKAIGRDFGDPDLIGGVGAVEPSAGSARGTLARKDATDKSRFRVSVGSAEHGVVSYPADETPFAIGDWLRLRPADVATVFALHDFAFATTRGCLLARWPVSARGAWQ